MRYLFWTYVVVFAVSFLLSLLFLVVGLDLYLQPEDRICVHSKNAYSEDHKVSSGFDCEGGRGGVVGVSFAINLVAWVFGFAAATLYRHVIRSDRGAA